MGFDDETFDVFCKKNISIKHIEKLIEWIDNNSGKTIVRHRLLNDYLKFIVRIGEFNDNQKHQDLRKIMYNIWYKCTIGTIRHNMLVDFNKDLLRLGKVFGTTAWFNYGKSKLYRKILGYIYDIYDGNTAFVDEINNKINGVNCRISYCKMLHEENE